jgi:hypothetical protein
MDNAEDLLLVQCEGSQRFCPCSCLLVGPDLLHQKLCQHPVEYDLDARWKIQSLHQENQSGLPKLNFELKSIPTESEELELGNVWTRVVEWAPIVCPYDMSPYFRKMEEVVFSQAKLSSE